MSGLRSYVLGWRWWLRMIASAAPAAVSPAGLAGARLGRLQPGGFGIHHASRGVRVSMTAASSGGKLTVTGVSGWAV